MLIPITSISTIVQEFIRQHIIPKAPNPITQFGLGFVIPYVSPLIDQYMNKYINMMKLSGIVSDNDCVDIDKAKQSAMIALDQIGGKLNIFGYVMDRDDIDKLCVVAQRYQVTNDMDNLEVVKS